MIFIKKGLMAEIIAFTCAQCNFCIESKKKLRHHIKTSHLDILKEKGDEKESIKCSQCDLVFRYKGNLLRHIKSIHENESVKPESWKCWVCGSVYSYRANMLRHVKIQHPDSTIPEKKFKHCCTECPRRFNQLYNLKCHMRKMHNICVQEPLKHKCPLCSELLPGRMTLVCNHLNDKHGVAVVKKELQFNSFKKFLNWKEKIERETNACFITFARRGDTREEYRCHRSGVFVSKSKGLRKLKTQGSNKIDSICPASIILYKKDAGAYEVLFIETHVGHENEIKHLRLSEKDRLSIACKIASRIPFDTILNDLSKSTCHSRLERKHLLTKKDLYNIQSMYGLNTERTQDDSSIDWWVVETASTSDSCIIFYKTQGIQNKLYSNDKDFILIIMNDLQREVLVTYSNVICLDRTQCLNKHNLELITVFVLNENKAFPCVLIVTNKTEKDDFIHYFKLLREEAQQLTPEIILTDLEPVLYDSWCEVMGTPKTRMFSPWHVDWAIRKNLNRIKNKDKQITVYQSILNLIEEREEISFQTKLQLVLSSLENNEDTAEFFEYFKSQFIDTISLWSDFQREQHGFKNKTELVLMHKTIKYLYLNKNNVQYVNKAICDIMKYIKDNLTSLFVNHEDVSFKMEESSARHDKASAEFSGARIMVQNNTWKVDFPGIPDSEIFTVNKNNDDCDCSLLCSSCSVCLHAYSCSCSDSCLKWNMCVHCHLVCCYLNATKDTCLLSSDVIYYDYINLEPQGTISSNGDTVVEIPTTVTVISTLRTDLNTDINNASISTITDSFNTLSNCVASIIVNTSNVQDSFDESYHTGSATELVSKVENSEQMPNLDTLIETLDQRRTNLSRKILNLLNYVENIESVEMVDAIEKFLVPIESTMVTLNKI